MKKVFTAVAIIATTFLPAQAQLLPAYLDDSKPIEQRVEDALSRMTLDEKIRIIHAQSKFSSAGVPRLGLPDFWTDDGPHGVRPDVLWDEWEQAGQTNDSCVAFPALTCLAASWNPAMARLYGESLGEEARYRGKDMILGPGVNICRTPLGGRNFEYMGEDPLLASRMVVPYVQGLQSKGVAACVKHYALNNDEEYRHQVNVILSDRALHEIYLPAFRAAVTEGKAWGIMGAYNLYQNQHNCHNAVMLNQILKQDWQFDGVVVSDWGGTHDTEEAVFNGLDMEFGTWTDGLTMGATNAYDNYYLADPFKKLISEATGQRRADLLHALDEKVRRVLRLFFRTTMNRQRAQGFLCSDDHYDAARKIAGEGIVLLKNSPVAASSRRGEVKDLLLPLDISKYNKVLVVGENAIKMMTVGGGSSSLKVQKEILPLDGLNAQLSVRREATLSQSEATERTLNSPLGAKRRFRSEAEKEPLNSSARREATLSQSEATERTSQLSIDYARGYVGDTIQSYNGVTVGRSLYDLRSEDELISEAVAKAREADVVIMFGGLNKSDYQDCEGHDRKQYELPYAQNRLIEALAEANPRLVFVNISGNAVAMPWLSKVPAVVQGWFIGSEAGEALADVLTGKVNPSGKLPFTWPASLSDVPAHRLNAFPGTWREDHNVIDEEYKEGIFVGYRGVDKFKTRPLFAFGHGLSYTTFALGKAAANKKILSEKDNITFTVSVTNTGNCTGSEVVQLYVSDLKASVERPKKELKAFQKVSLQPGETRLVELTIDATALSFYDEQQQAWRAEPGDFEALIGTASDNISSKVKFTLK